MAKRREQRDLKLKAAQTLIDVGWSVIDAIHAVGYATGTSGHLSLKVPKNRALGRATRMSAMYREGQTLEEIGVQFNVSRERVRQILNESGIDGRHGGRTKRKWQNDVARREREARRLKARAEKVLGVDWDTALRLNDGISTFYTVTCKARSYLTQKRSALSRGIGWEMTFADWCRVWDESGKWAQRGRGKYDCCMSRKGDAGPYSYDNVRIITNEQNVAEGWDVNPYNNRVRPTGHMRKTQLRVFQLRQEGKSHKEIGAELGITPKTSLQYCVAGKRIAQAA